MAPTPVPSAGPAIGDACVVGTWRVTKDGGTLRSPVVFINGHESLEPIDASAAHATLSINGGAQQPYPLGSDETLSYTCSGNALTETDTIGDVYTYRRVSSTP